VRPAALDELLETPGALEELALELGATSTPSAFSQVELLEHIRRRAIHLAVTASPWCGLSIEELIVMIAYTSPRFEHTTWKRQLSRQPSEQELQRVCERWLLQRSAVIGSGRRFGKPRWPLVGYSAVDQQARDQFRVGVAPFSNAAVLWGELDRLASEAGLANEHYVACSPATALAVVDLHAHATRQVRYDSLVLDRRLRTLGIGLLLIEPDGVLLYLPARYQPLPE
jgi:hypothetical protein